MNNPQNSYNKDSAENVKSSSQQPIYYMPVSQPQIDEDEINLLDYWRILMRYKWMIVLITLLSGSIAVFVAMNATEIYRAEVVLAPAGEDQNSASALSNQFGGLAALAGVNLGGGGGQLQESIATLKSRVFTEAFINDLNLMPVLYEKIWDVESKRWLVEDEKEIPSALAAYKLIDGMRSITDDKKTGMYVLAFEWSDPELAAQWANVTVERINKHQKEKAIIEAQNSIKYLEDQIEETSAVEMRQAIYRLIEAQTKNIMLASVRDEFVFRVIDPAVVPEERIKPKKKLMVVLGLMVGFMLSIFLAFFLAFIKKQKELSVDENNKNQIES